MPDDGGAGGAGGAGRAGGVGGAGGAEVLLPDDGRAGGAGGVDVLLPDDVVSAAASQAQPARAQDETPEWPVTAHAPVSLHPCSPASLPEVGR